MKLENIFHKKSKCAALETEVNALRATIKIATEFVKSIEKGNLEATLEGINESEINRELTLEGSLLSMRDQMKAIAEKEKERNWATEGLAKFVEILRTNNQDLRALCDHILTNLVKYIGANQGGLYIVNEDEDNNLYLELTSCYAYNRKKYLEKRIDAGEGLAGQCLLEKATIYMTDVPKNYVTITSGLGESLPRNILIVPLMINEIVYGIVEIASFQKIEPYQIEFMEKLGESIASTISSVKIAERTKKLLEESTERTEQMRAQEEEMRQNLEEMQAIQEQQQRLQRELQISEEKLKSKIDKASNHAKVLSELKRNKQVLSGNIENALIVITETLANTLEVSRASVWQYNESEKNIQCLNLFERDVKKHSNGVVLPAEPFPGYFKALLSEEIIIAENAHTHPATKEFSEVYLTPLNICSMLDVPYFINGKLGGVICFEHQGQHRQWDSEDVIFTTSVADVITMAYLIEENKSIKNKSEQNSLFAA